MLFYLIDFVYCGNHRKFNVTYRIPTHVSRALLAVASVRSVVKARLTIYAFKIRDFHGLSSQKFFQIIGFQFLVVCSHSIRILQDCWCFVEDVSTDQVSLRCWVHSVGLLHVSMWLRFLRASSRSRLYAWEWCLKFSIWEAPLLTDMVIELQQFVYR